MIAQADREHRDEITATPHAILDTAALGRIIASLGQAVRYVSLNHDALTGGEPSRWSAIGILDNGGNGLTMLGVALADSVRTGTATVILPDEAIVYARRALSDTIDNITYGRWSFGESPADIDDKVATRMSADLACLPAASTPAP